MTEQAVLMLGPAPAPRLKVWRRLVAGTQPDATVVGGQWQLEEGRMYNFQLLGAAGGTWSHPRHVEPTTPDGLRGLIRTREAVGLLPLQFRADGEVWTVRVRVRPRKLDQERFDALRAALERHSRELTLHATGPALQGVDRAKDPAVLLYSRAISIAAFLDDDRIEAAFARILERPHHAWSMRERLRPVEAPPSRPSSRPRPSTSGRYIVERAMEQDADTLPNRFVRFVLDDWLAVVDALSVSANLRDVSSLELAGMRVRLEALQQHPLLRDVGAVSPEKALTSTAIRRRDGYREVLEAWIQTCQSLAIVPEGAEPHILAGQRSVAMLYEIWCCLTVIDVLNECADVDQTTEYLTPNDAGTVLMLRTGADPVRSWTTTKHLRPLSIRVFYNRSFSPGGKDESWTLQMRPDVTVDVRPYGGLDNTAVLVHFDAKYRLGDLVANEFGEDELTDEQAASGGHPRAAARADLLKMHAYRDAIRHSGGAYVLYPGTSAQPSERQEFPPEILPGLGAIALTPAQGGATGVAELRLLMESIIDHVGNPDTADAAERQFRIVTRTSATSSAPRENVLLVPSSEFTAKGWSGLIADPGRPSTILVADWIGTHPGVPTEDLPVWRISSWTVERTDNGSMVTAHVHGAQSIIVGAMTLRSGAPVVVDLPVVLP